MYCSKCGAELVEGALFCSACGQPTSGRPAVTAGEPIGGFRTAPISPPLPHLRYAGFWLRLWAYLLDGLLLGVAFLVVLVLLAMVTGLGSAIGNIHPSEQPQELVALLGVTLIVGIMGVAVIGTWLYYALLESSSWQATLGKKALGLQVTNLAGYRISFGRASGRYFAKFVTNLIPLAIGYIMAGFTEKKQALHDMIASCLVVRRT